MEKMDNFDYLAQTGNEDRPGILSSSFDGFCLEDPMFHEVFETAYPPNQAFPGEVTTGHEDSSQSAYSTL